MASVAQLAALNASLVEMKARWPRATRACTVCGRSLCWHHAYTTRCKYTKRTPCIHHVMQARLSMVEAEEAQQKEELNTFYLMWAGRETPAYCALLHPLLRHRTHSSNPQLLRASCVRLL